jgi:hypothetical protein
MDPSLVADQERRKVVERLLRAWRANPHLRLGQLLSRTVAGVKLEYVFDDELLGLLEANMPKSERQQLARDFPLKGL